MLKPKRNHLRVVRNEMASYNGNGNGSNGQRVFYALSLCLSLFSLFMSLGFSFYTVVNPKGEAILIRQEAREDTRRAEDRLGAELLRIKEVMNKIKNLQDQIKLLQSRLDMVRRVGPGTTANSN